MQFNHGAGIENDPVRRVFAYYTEDGVLLAWHDTQDGPRKIDPGFMQELWL